MENIAEILPAKKYHRTDQVGRHAAYALYAFVLKVVLKSMKQKAKQTKCASYLNETTAQHQHILGKIMDFGPKKKQKKNK